MDEGNTQEHNDAPVNKALAPIDRIKARLNGEHKKQIINFFNNEQQALEFLTNVADSLRRIPKLQDCEPDTILNSFMTMASLKLMPSSVSGEAYVLPYKKGGTDMYEAQFQLGYQGIVTLLYRAGNKEVVAELVREHDVFSINRGKIQHEIDPRKSKSERGAVIGAYAIITTAQGGTVEQYMTLKDIVAHGKKYSKSFNSKYSPWNEENDSEGWMYRKTVLKQASKLAPKNEVLNRAIAEDNKDSNIQDRLEKARVDTKELTMGNLRTDNEETKENSEEEAT